MGSSTSKAAKAAAATAPRRQYPTRIPPTPATPTAPPPSAGQTSVPEPAAYPKPQAPDSYARETKDESITTDGADPDFAASLRSLGPVQPNSTLSNTSTFRSASAPQNTYTSHDTHLPPTASSPASPAPANQARIFPDPSQNPALAVLTARTRLAEEAEREFAKARVGGERRFLDVGTIRSVLAMREQGVGEGEIERRMGLGRGVVGLLRRVGHVSVGKVDAGDSGIY